MGDVFLTIIDSFLVNRNLVVNLIKAMLSGAMISLGRTIFAVGYSRNRHWRFQRAILTGRYPFLSIAAGGNSRPCLGDEFVEGYRNSRLII